MIERGFYNGDAFVLLDFDIYRALSRLNLYFRYFLVSRWFCA